MTKYCRSLDRLLLGTCIAALLAMATPLAAQEQTAPARTPADASADPAGVLAALTAALQAKDGDALADLLGPEHRADLIGGDPAQARQWMDELSVLANQGARLEPAADSAMTVVMGREDCPMPVPLVKADQGWRYDTTAGLEEIDDRHVGSNELTAIGLLRQYVEARLDYADDDRDGDQVLEYARKIVSSAGQKGGLYWQAEGDAELSPLRPLVAGADAYTRDYHERGEPYHGYYYKILTGEGAHPPGGRYDYVFNGNIIAGFAMVGWPADYGHSGVMTFAVNHLGKVFEKNLGEETETPAPHITT